MTFQLIHSQDEFQQLCASVTTVDIPRDLCHRHPNEISAWVDACAESEDISAEDWIRIRQAQFYALGIDELDANAASSDSNSTHSP